MRLFVLGHYSCLPQGQAGTSDGLPLGTTYFSAHLCRFCRIISVDSGGHYDLDSHPWISPPWLCYLASSGMAASSLILKKPRFIAVFSAVRAGLQGTDSTKLLSTFCIVLGNGVCWALLRITVGRLVFWPDTLDPFPHARFSEPFDLSLLSQSAIAVLASVLHLIWDIASSKLPGAVPGVCLSLYLS